MARSVGVIIGYLLILLFIVVDLVAGAKRYEAGAYAEASSYFFMSGFLIGGLACLVMVRKAGC